MNPIPYEAIKAALTDSQNWQVLPAYPNSEYPETREKMELVSSKGVKIFIDLDRKDKTKIEISHFRPHRPHHLGSSYVEVYKGGTFEKLHAPSIGCSLSKSPAQIARDIEKRILPMAEEITQLVFEKIKVEQAEYEARKVTLEAVANSAGEKVHFHGSMQRTETPEGKVVHTFVPNLSSPHYEFSVMPSTRSGGYIHACNVQSSSCVQINFASMTREQACKLLEFVTSSKLLTA